MASEVNSISAIPWCVVSEYLDINTLRSTLLLNKTIYKAIWDRGLPEFILKYILEERPLTQKELVPSLRSFQVLTWACARNPFICLNIPSEVRLDSRFRMIMKVAFAAMQISLLSPNQDISDKTANFFELAAGVLTSDERGSLSNDVLSLNKPETPIWDLVEKYLDCPPIIYKIIAQNKFNPSQALKKKLFDEYHDDKVFFTILLKNSPQQIEHASVRLQIDSSLIKLILPQDACVEYIPESAIRCKNTLINLLTLYPERAHWVAARFPCDIEIARVVVQVDGLSLIYFGPNIWRNRQVVYEAISQCGSAIQHAARELRSDRELVLHALKKDPQLYSWVSEFLPSLIKDDEEISKEVQKCKDLVDSECRFSFCALL